MKILIVKNGEVIEGKEALFKQLVADELDELLEVDKFMRVKSPEKMASVKVPTEQDASKSLIDQCYRFGSGCITLDNDDGIEALLFDDPTNGKDQ